jgi:hypothetical protein
MESLGEQFAQEFERQKKLAECNCELCLLRRGLASGQVKLMGPGEMLAILQKVFEVPKPPTRWQRFKAWWSGK